MQPDRVVNVERIHDAAVFDAAVADPALIQTRDRMMQCCLRQRGRELVHTSDVGCGAGGLRRTASLVRMVIVPPVAEG